MAINQDKIHEGGAFAASVIKSRTSPARTSGRPVGAAKSALTPKQIADIRAMNLGSGVLNINSLDTNDARGRSMSQAETEWDIEYSKRRGDWNDPSEVNGRG